MTLISIQIKPAHATPHRDEKREDSLILIFATTG